MDYKEKSIMTDLLAQNQALRNAANGFKARCEELEARNKRLEEARENANAACAKWEGLYRAKLEKKAAWVSVKDRLPETGGIYIVTACDEGVPYGEGIWYSTVVVCAEYYKGDWVWYEGSQEY